MVRTLAHNADVEFRTVGRGAIIVPSPWITNLVSRNGGLGWHGVIVLLAHFPLAEGAAGRRVAEVKKGCFKCSKLPPT